MSTQISVHGFLPFELWVNLDECAKEDAYLLKLETLFVVFSCVETAISFASRGSPSTREKKKKRTNK